MSELDQLVAHIHKVWPDPKVLVREAEPYRSLPLCVIDAVYSIGVRYESTERTVRDFCKSAGWDYEHERTIGEFLDLLAGYVGRWEHLAVEVFRNRQRTSPRSGILKAEAVYRFATELHRSGINALSDVHRIASDGHLLASIAAIPGQGSGISLKYFLMLAGNSGFIKPDRMVARFVGEALGRDVRSDVAEALVLSAHEVLKTEVPRLTATMLDYEIWSHQRNRPRRANPGTPICR